VAFHRGIDGSEPVGGLGGGAEELRRVARSGHVASGTLACPLCDAPLALPAPHVSPADPVGCPFCGHAAAVRDFLSLAVPTRPTRVAVRVVQRR
jgi:hypothetical protein